MFLYVQVCVRTRTVRGSDLKQSSELLRIWIRTIIRTSDHVQMVSTWVNISQAVVGTSEHPKDYNSDDMQVKWRFGPGFRSEQRSDPPPLGIGGQI